MTTGDDKLYDELAAKHSDQSLIPSVISEVLVGEAAATSGRALLVDSFGSVEAVDEFIRRGRPRLGAAEAVGSSHEIRGRVTDSQYQAIRQLMVQSNRTMSEMVRDMTDVFLKIAEDTPKGNI